MTNSKSELVPVPNFLSKVQNQNKVNRVENFQEIPENNDLLVSPIRLRNISCSPTVVEAVHLLLQNYAQLSEAEQPLIPFMIIKDIISNNLQAFMNAVVSSNQDVIDFREKGNRLISSCLNTAYGISMVFFGEKFAKKIINSLNNSTLVNFSISLPPGEVVEFRIRNSFDGYLTHERIKRKEGLTSEQVKTCLKSNIKSFTNYAKPILDEIFTDTNSDRVNHLAKLKNRFSKGEYNFNTPIFQALKKDIEDNKNNTNSNTTFIYFIAIVHMSSFDHVFLIEQFYNKQRGVSYRRYQSWIDEATLLNDLAKQDYDREGEKTWNEKEMYQFLENFEALYLPENDQVRESSERCFGYPGSNGLDPWSLVYEINDRIIVLSGAASLRYYSSAIHPKQCIENLTAFLCSHPKFEKDLAASLPKQEVMGRIKQLKELKVVNKEKEETKVSLSTSSSSRSVLSVSTVAIHQAGMFSSSTRQSKKESPMQKSRCTQLCEHRCVLM